MLLLNVSGIGPKVAISILSHLKADNLKKAIINNDIKQIVSIPGLGKKGAQRIIIELKDKIKDIPSDGKEVCQHKETEEIKDAINGLIALGYKLSQAKESVNAVCENETGYIPTEKLIKKALQFLKIR